LDRNKFLKTSARYFIRAQLLPAFFSLPPVPSPS
jgi:hypothetical protein